MNEHDLEEFEQELRALRPAAVPPELVARLADARPLAAPVNLSLRAAESSSRAAATSSHVGQAAGKPGFSARRPSGGWKAALTGRLESLPYNTSLRARRLLLRWLAPAAALAVAVVLAWPALLHRTPSPQATAAPRVVNANSVRLDQQLIGAFDAVGRLPDGEAVRFRYQKWMDQIVVKDEASGVVIQQRTPRVEVIPVSFETQ